MTLEGNSYSNWFISRVNSLRDAYMGKQAVLVFLGVSPLQARVLAKLPDSAPGMVSFADEGFYSPADFQAHKKEAYRLCLTTDGPVIMLYEQMLEIKGALSEMYDGQIVIVTNNLFAPSEGYPAPVSKEALSAFAGSLDDMGAKDSPMAKYYASVLRCTNGLLATPIVPDALSECEHVNLYESTATVMASSTPQGAELLPMAPAATLALRLDISSGGCAPTAIECSSKASAAQCGTSHLGVLATLAKEAGLPITFVTEAAGTQEAANADLLLPMLKRYWGDEAEFRDLSFYKYPDRSNEMELVSQGTVCEFVTRQAIDAYNGSSTYKDTLLTAPTGAGKSILFQLPALYLAEEFKTVTLVIEPLKALMTDQVNNLRNRGVKNVVAINSDIAYEERLQAYERIGNGSASVIYLSPELLLESSLDSILNGRELGLVIVDEVHTVTSWGKDFRPDYWYLGPFLAKLRKNGTHRFPIFCLTATAVYGGRDDVVNQTIRDLELGDCRIFLGNPRRENIDFQIRPRSKGDFRGTIEDVKTEFTTKWITETVDSGRHAIVYCPYRSQVERVIDANKCGSKVLGYHGGMDKEYKGIVSKSFKNGSCRVLVSTKAFGMGIDIDDIGAVYHYAPTGNLSDYVQEIGRGGRKRGMRAVAAVDFFGQDTRYADQLYALSRFSQWQLKEIMAKLCEIYYSQPKETRSQNMLVSPDTFSYLFADEKDESRKANRVKSGLMMVARDLEDRYNFPVVIVRPKMSYTVQYVCIDASAEDAFVSKYAEYLQKKTERHTRTENRTGQNRVTISDSGAIYALSIGKMWEQEFSQYSFADFKRQLFNGDICSQKPGVPAVSNRLILDVAFSESYEDASDKVAAFAEALDEALLELGRKGDFTVKDFQDVLSPKLDERGVGVTNYRELLNAFVSPTNADKNRNSVHTFKCVKRIARKQDYGRALRETAYEVIGRDRISTTKSLVQTMYSRLRVAEGEKLCRRYLSCDALGPLYALAEILQILNLATYTVKGGDNPEVFIRLNDPAKLRALSQDKRYRNNVLRELNDRHEYSSKVIRGFFLTKLDDSERWDVIEEYFLGNDDYVAQRLGIDDVASGKARPKVRHSEKAIEHAGAITTLREAGTKYDCPLFRVWNELANACKTSAELADVRLLKGLTHGSHFAAPSKDAVLEIESTGTQLHPTLVWEEKRVLLFLSERANEYAKAQSINWKHYILGQGESISELAEDIKTKQE
jgi:ATP-dependent DNA helicase RecQ